MIGRGSGVHGARIACSQVDAITVSFKWSRWVIHDVRRNSAQTT
jgi:hypothetical protein